MSEHFFKAWHFDGKSAVRRPVDIQGVGNNFYLVETERRHGPFAFADVSYIGEQDGAHVYGLEENDGWRLGLKGEVPAELTGLLPAPRRYGGWVDRLGLGKASIAFAAISAAVVAVVLLTPQWLAPLIPTSWERQMGDALVGDFGGRFCAAPAGSKALAKMTASLDSDAEDLQVEIANIDMVNAIALPGGKVIIFQGLLDIADSPDEVAGVLAHEIGHVRKRHVMQGLLRQMGLSVVLGGADGAGGGLLNGVLSMSYGRDAEREADSHSIRVMSIAGISPVATAGFFRRLSKMDGSDKMEGRSARITGYMSSHPLSSERKKAFENSLSKGKKYRPSLTNAEWKSLKTMCEDDPDVESGFGFDFGEDAS
ncbi:MAG: M48 family metallopeptidase [Sphingorhabdus sp.]